MKRSSNWLLGLGLVLASARAPGEAQQHSRRTRSSRGADVYATYCMACHGWQMELPGRQLRSTHFPPGQFARFENAVIKGKNNMPPWGEVLQPGDIEALWAYVMAGEKK